MAATAAPEQFKSLASLPSMFFRSLFTVARKDVAAADAFELTAYYQAPAFSPAQQQAFQDSFAGFRSELPLALLYCLAQRVHLAQMLEPDFPWPAPGLVHVSNALRQHAPIDSTQGFQLTAHVAIPARGPKVSARRLRPLFTVDFYQNEQHVASCLSEYQVMPKDRGKPSKKREQKSCAEPAAEWHGHDSWKLTETTAREYARLSGDFNPIHLHPWLSRWFGFAQPIIHGMYMAARAQAELERFHQRPLTAIEVTFKRPVPLPAEIKLWHQTSDDDGNGSYQICGAEDHLQRLEGRYQLG
ncbi:MaoC family dehydratase [Pseudidiomarina taiwanensis]|uniref:Acyl dehydratase n=1 Tax=Pseudidiomarina taiwanensis TaxID=337250 RepID=A0A432ZFQ2_9GAMM|nr:MaoC/PaaZ C-terminal domain-containing protein [Pseudidiomarina taiwanensis]RUO76797.1 acyl dehydratase [Pseudidiomarina taiwanensis]